MSAGKDNKAVAVELFKKYAIILVLVAMVLILTLLNSNFLSIQNLSNVLQQMAAIMIMAFGVQFIIITGGIDLGLGAYVALASVIAATLSKGGTPAVLAVLAGLGVGLACGCINGGIIVTSGIPPFIVTMGMTQITRGFALLYTGGKPVSMLGADFVFLGKGSLFGFLPMPIFIVILVFIVSSVLLNKTKFGKYVRAIGGNENAARISGISTKLYKFLAYVYSGLCCGIAAVVLSARIDSGQPGLAEGYELDAIASVVIGGTSLNGGLGAVWGTLVGSMIIGSLNTGLNLLNVSSYWQKVCKGIIIIVAIVLDERKNRVKG